MDNDCFVFDEAEGRVVRFVPKAESPSGRSDSRQFSVRPESSLSGKAFSPQPGLTRAESVHSVSEGVKVREKGGNFHKRVGGKG